MSVFEACPSLNFIHFSFVSNNRLNVLEGNSKSGN